MNFLLVLWLSQHPGLVGTEQGSHQLVLAALALTHDHTQVLTRYERSLLDRVGRREMTLPHLLAYLQEHEQA
ncbi:hypothetical protein [uncultured Hymenobacter sp.]|uniref:hypothetical protein n=1 Tax=uncultured Hymenobacter sp. TaxID=170016 RepID=UPI0035CBE1A9